MSALFKEITFFRRRYTKQPAFIIHADETWIDAILNDQFDFFVKLAQKARSEGMKTYVVPTKSKLSQIKRKQKHIHIHVGQRFAKQHDLNYKSSVLFTMPSYIWGFWYLDTHGVVYYSSIGGKKFKAKDINSKKAEYFYNGVSDYNLKHNRSKFDQTDRTLQKIQKADAVIYLQNIEKYKNPVHYLSNVEMIDTVARACNGLVYVKLHPMQDAENCHDIKHAVSKFNNVIISVSSIHDLSEASNVVVTQNSAAGFEALMQKKTVITCAKCDFHHATITCKTISELKAAIISAENIQKTFPFEKYLYWFLNEQLLEPDKPEFITRAWEKCLALLEN